ncbi:hypothetical protein JCM30237_04170 [Halolamina litorea]|uniref:Uncharacterized protein n=1 Tax=Halolamina litorea TaxID=1515593 RepID=A0ABD6BQC5_9EURY|nr:hypothetical protein [Halolamina litorea]
MAGESTLPGWLDRWLTLKQPVTYWSFWAALLRLLPLFVLPFLVTVAVVTPAFAVRAFAPLPFVLVAATLGYAVRAFDGVGALVSVLIAALYSFLLGVTGVGESVVSQPTPLLSVLAVLAFVALLAGFGSPTLHGQRGDDEFAAARRRWED